MTTTKKTTKTAEAKTVESKAAETVEAAVNASKEAVETVMKASTDAFAGIGFDDVVAYNRSNMEAMMKFSTIWTKGVQDMSKELTDLANASMEQNVAATKQILDCKSVEDVVAVQADLAKTNYDKAVVEGRKLSEMGVKLAENAAAPITARVNETVATFSKPLAA